MEELIKKLKTLGYALKGCTISEIHSFELSNGIKLPKVYIEFLLAMGKDAGNFMKGSDYCFENVLNLKEWANETLKENSLPLLPINAFVFWIHQGYQFAFFYLNTSDDPEIYAFDETEKIKGIKKKFACLSDFFLKQVSV